MQNQNNNQPQPTPPGANLDFKISSSSPQLGIFSQAQSPAMNPIPAAKPIPSTPTPAAPPVAQVANPAIPVNNQVSGAATADTLRTTAMSAAAKAHPALLNQTAHPTIPVQPIPTNRPNPQNPAVAPAPSMPTSPSPSSQTPNLNANAATPQQPASSPQTKANDTNTKTPEAANLNPSSTQATLLISELRDSTVIMKDGSFRAVIACKPVNFDLMSENERSAVEYAYQGFLNSLNFNVQILVRSQKVDISPYVGRLSKLRQASDNMLLNMLMDDYIDFVLDVAQYANIMDKSFFIVIPYYTTIDTEKAIQQTRNLFSSLGFGKKKEAKVTRINRDVYEKAIDELKDRANTVMSGLYKIGVHNVRLNTKELGELYYNFNNPDTAIREPLGDFSRVGQLYTQQKPNPLKNNNGEIPHV